MIQQAAWESLKESDIMPQIAEWPEIGDILSAAITRPRPAATPAS